MQYIDIKTIIIMALTIGGNTGDIAYAQDNAQQTFTKYHTTHHDIQQAVDFSTTQHKEELIRSIQQLEEQLQSQQPEKGLIIQCLQKIKDIAPDVIEVVTVAFANPLLAIGIAFDKILKD